MQEIVDIPANDRVAGDSTMRGLHMGPASAEPELRSYLGVLRRRKLLVAAAALLVVAVVVGLSLLQQPSYRATAAVLLQQPASSQVVLPSAPQSPAQDRARVQTEVDVMRSRKIAGAVDDALGRRVTVDIEMGTDSNVVSISAEDHDPAEAAHVAQTYAETYVRVRRDQLSDDLRQSAAEVQQQIDRINAQMSTLSAQVSSLDAQIAATLDPAQRQTLTEQRDRLAARNASETQGLQTRLTTYTGQLQNLQLAGNLNAAGGAQIVSDAEAPSSPVSPKPVRNGVIALFVGLLLGVGVAFLRDHLDDTIKTKDDLDAVDVPVLSVVPRVDGWKDRGRAELVARADPTSPAAEAYRTLRTSVQFLGLERTVRLIQITSPREADGKTTTIANLGVTLARAGKRVVIADCDLRRPRVESFFGVSNERGFTNVLLGETDLADAVVPLANEPLLAVLPAGPPPPNPSELLGTRHAEDTLRLLAEEADYVLVDGPPVLPVTDGIILAGIVDGTVVVVAANSTTKRQTRAAFELLEQVSAPIIGTVLNGVTVGQDGYAYKYAYAADQKRRRRRRRSDRRRRRGRRSETPAKESATTF